MNRNRTLPRLLAGALAAAAWWTALPAAAQQPAPVPPEIQSMAAAIAGELAARCPLAEANDVAAFEHCRSALYGDSKLRSHLQPVVLWGRQSTNANATLRQTNLTQFAPDTWTHLYAPLFMFNGRYQVEWVPHERQYVVRLEAAFRNRLAPGQFPYPFWHEEAKWSMYQNANGFLLWVHPHTGRIQAAQFTDRAANPPLHAVRPVQHKFEGKWLWTDGGGRVQPAVTLFDGLYRPENPYLPALDRQYRDLALQMRESQCTSCHVPNNPDKMSRLVLLSTPAHAAGEIDRLIKSVREDKMPMDEFRNSYALKPEDKKWLLESAEVFKSTVQSARAWEAEAAGRDRPVALKPARAMQRPEVSQ
ncbi:hypothetical protein WG902_02275 [Ramlibacter sp. PS3R-8]|uniref:hypothetical protein n=1 Tax=Ramlibacter sp. PS3R-8 TaxID=3133437 RepID=UPI0030B2DD31